MYAASGDHVRLHWAEGLGHRRILADAGVVRMAVAFLAEPPAQALVAYDRSSAFLQRCAGCDVSQRFTNSPME